MVERPQQSILTMSSSESDSDDTADQEFFRQFSQREGFKSMNSQNQLSQVHGEQDLKDKRNDSQIKSFQRQLSDRMNDSQRDSSMSSIGSFPSSEFNSQVVVKIPSLKVRKKYHSRVSLDDSPQETKQKQQQQERGQQQKKDQQGFSALDRIKLLQTSFMTKKDIVQESLRKIDNLEKNMKDSDNEDDGVYQESNTNKHPLSSGSLSQSNQNSRQFCQSNQVPFEERKPKVVKQEDIQPFPDVELLTREDELVVSNKKFQEIESFFDNWLNGKGQNILILQGSSGVGKKTLISYLALRKFGLKITYLHRLKKLEHTALPTKKEEEYEGVSNSNQTTQSYSQNPLELLLYAFGRTLSPKLYEKEIVVLQEIPEGLQASDLKKINQFLNQRYLNQAKSLIKNPLVFILNQSIYSQSQINKVLKDQFGNSFSSVVREINLPKPSDKEIEKFIKRVMNKNNKFQDLSGYQRNILIEEIVATASGDISNAKNQMRMFLAGGKSHSKNQKAQKKDNQQKDNEFSIFHTLGKFLYNKRVFKQSKELPRQMSKEELMSGKTEFYFNPSSMIRQINCGNNFFRNALQQNYLDFYGSIEDVVASANMFAEMDILEQQNFMEKNECIKDENEFLISLIVGEGVMLNNYHGKEVQRKYCSIIKSQTHDFTIERKCRMRSIRKAFPFVSTRKYVQEYNHHLTMLPSVIAADMMKQKGQWKQTKVIDETANNINSIGFDRLGDNTNNNIDDDDPKRSMILAQKRQEFREILEDDIEEC